MSRTAITAIALGISISACGGGGGAAGGSTSMPTPFVSPSPASTACVTQTPGPASDQSKSRLGFYYFDGWSGALSNAHFKGLLSGQFTGREPVTGWQDTSPCAVEQQLAWARSFGIDFFVFDWYFNATKLDPGEDLNSALQLTRAMPNRHGMQFAILYVDSPPFVATPADWPSVVDEWTNYMTDPAYVRVNGKPLLMVIDIGEMHSTFGSSQAVAAAFSQLRTAAQTKGLPGVFIVGGFGVPEGSSGQDALFPDTTAPAVADGYDALSMYNYPFAAPPVNGMLPFTDLSAAGTWIWRECAAKCPLPAIPVAMDGWDPRPWNEADSAGQLVWYSRTPQDVSAFISGTIEQAGANPNLRVEPAPAPPMVIVEAWNELGEGSYLVPTVGDGSTYGSSLSSALVGP